MQNWILSLLNQTKVKVRKIISENNKFRDFFTLRITNTSSFASCTVLKTKFTKMKSKPIHLSKELSLTITEIQATQPYAEKQREAEELAIDIKRHAVACKRKFVHYCDALRKKQRADFDSYVESKNKKKQKFMQKMMNMIESNI